MDSLDLFLDRQRRRVRHHLADSERHVRLRKAELKTMDVETRQSNGAQTCSSTRGHHRTIETELRRLEQSV